MSTTTDTPRKRGRPSRSTPALSVQVPRSAARHEDGREHTYAGLTATGWLWGVYLAVLLVIASLT